MLNLLYLYLNLHLHLHLLKNRIIPLLNRGLRRVAMARETNWLFGTVVSHILTDYMTTGPVSTMSRKRYSCYRVPKILIT